jgi:hypothetical protein
LRRKVPPERDLGGKVRRDPNNRATFWNPDELPGDQAGCSSFFASGFSITGPCVSAVGGGGASPIRFE